MLWDAVGFHCCFVSDWAREQKEIYKKGTNGTARTKGKARKGNEKYTQPRDDQYISSTSPSATSSMSW